jgi:SHS2 domain-containing protein
MVPAMMFETDYVLLDHTADLGIQVFGTDLPDLYERAARALVSLMVAPTVPSPAATSRLEVSVEAQDPADLLVRFLGEILYLFEGERILPTSVTVGFISLTRLEATLETVPFDPKFHDVLHEIKAVTYHQIEVTRRNDRWEARVILDI